MMFRRSALFATVALLLSSTGSTNAFVPVASRSAPSSSRLFFSTEAPQKMGAKVELKPEYEAALKGAIQKLQVGLGDKAEKLLPMLEHFVGEYLGAAQLGGESAPEEEKEMYSPKAATARILQGIQLAQKFGMPDSPDLYKFGVTHTALRGDEPENELNMDYYAFGCDFFRPAMNMEKSVVLGMDNLKKAMEQVQNGENVVFFANHQSEADPQVVSCLMESVGFEKEAADMIYVAGHKVTTDPLAIPFSMGRNLICIHSKKHIDADPETKPAKQRQNMKAMSAMLDKFKEGGCLLWVAPSGGRDRRDLETGKVPPAPFDRKTIDYFRLMGNKSKKPMHYYSMAMVSYDLCPPPDFVEAGVGEQRNVRYVPIGIQISEELESVGGLETREEFTKGAMEACLKGYAELNEALGIE